MAKNEILFEMRRAGNTIKVTAIDPKTGIEATIVAPASLSLFSLKQQAIRKLEYVKNKKLEEN